MCAGLALLLSACGQPPGESGASKPPTSAPEPEFVTTDQPRTSIGVDVACGTTCVITIDGDITPELSNYLLAIATEPRITTSARRIVKISSDGGDVNHALVIGKLFRLMEATVEVPQGKHCFSSCVLILAGGVLRGPLGSIGIHRPYFSDGAASYAEAQNRYGSLKPQVVEFLELGGVNPALWEDMLRTPPEDKDSHASRLRALRTVWPRSELRGKSRPNANAEIEHLSPRAQ